MREDFVNNDTGTRMDSNMWYIHMHLPPLVSISKDETH